MRIYEKLQIVTWNIKALQKHKKSKSPAIEMIAGLNFNIQMIYSSKKGKVKGRVLIDLYCNVMNFKNSKIA